MTYVPYDHECSGKDLPPIPEEIDLWWEIQFKRAALLCQIPELTAKIEPKEPPGNSVK